MTQVKQQIKVFVPRRDAIFSYLYAFFLVFIVPLAIPVALWTIWAGKVKAFDILMAVILYSFSGLGITLGYHRLVTHRAFQTKAWLKRVLLIGASFAMQGPPASWASLHIQHHRFSDKPGDPHSPSQLGFWQSHCGWIFHNYRPDFRRYGKWLLKDNDVRHISKYYLYYSNLGLLIPFLLNGWVGLVWGGFLRLFISSHMTWSVNSICHRWGTQAYRHLEDQSKNNFLIALFTFGEGWHNNHHRYLQMPFFGHRWYQLDIGKWVILALQKCRLVWDLKLPKQLG